LVVVVERAGRSTRFPAAAAGRVDMPLAALQQTQRQAQPAILAARPVALAQ
jgi:hypothetical protein